MSKKKNTRLKVWFIMPFWIFLSGIADAASRGGSNYAWYQVDANCYRESYGVVSNYNTKSAIINSQLQAMYNSGQRRLRIPIYHGRGLNTGTVMSSTGGDLPTQKKTNLSNLLAKIKQIGFSEIEIGFFPIEQNSPVNWTQWQQSYYDENWALIQNIRPIVAAAGINYKIDLMNEGSPPSYGAWNIPFRPYWSQYAMQLWAAYTSNYGKADTVGFSIPVGPDIYARVPHLKYIYNNNLPFLFEVHIYGRTGADESDKFLDLRQRMVNEGLGNKGWIIGEAWYNNQDAANDFSTSIAQTGQTVFYVTQWPLAEGSSCANASLAPPSNFSNFINQGF